ncbi:conserved hypothetical protein [Culex quinquefasciatus]|uniref:BTB domain-containing protein n=1 Tax=Culex quinquefasciatus TaxID=7176 RepID=B0W641_CULQU|nr:conserved hypothetical protein [Culex quinquefasciatus]|eukprot:XP_001844175.1 conserved hypothetical protein [Culex quinquefasciatus]
MFTNWLAPPPTTSLPPDTIIEVGPPPFTRYAAHSALVSAHSGYLRAALRSDSSTGSTTAETIPIYVPNVTAEQFTPLLTYMYTGFLDLNIENIFGVLLATHILHMPRALELCRAFLSASQQQQQQQQQSENYFSGLNAISAVASKPKLEAETSKVVRPIASKATGIGLNFIAPPTSHILLPSTHTPFKSLSGVGLVGPTVATSVDTKCDSFSPPGSVKLTELTESSTATATPEEPPKPSKEHQLPPTTSHKRSSKSLKRASSSKSDSVVTTASKDSTNNSNNDKGVIVDIASCDGPVRFRRVLNDSYGINTANNNKTICTPDESSKGGNSRYMSTSFHQQMVRNINERKQAASSLASGESYTSSKDENSQDTNRPHSPQSASTTTTTNTIASTTTTTGETYNCVYCKHTFKSQYCYQKHAKRHLIPLSLEVGGGVQPDPEVDSEGHGEKQPTSLSSSSSVVRHAKSHHAAKREVKPLDMNVQYYPCKTCGSKFPSYYFVHKHRKMCHADEEVL